MLKKRISREELIAHGDIGNWPQVDKSLLSNKELALYSRREAALLGYLAGKDFKELSKTSNYSRQFIYRLLRKCIEPHFDGRIWGLRALIPYLHQKPYDRLTDINKNTSGLSGALSAFFDKHPDIREQIEVYFLKKAKGHLVHESRISYKSTFKRFLDACKAKGIRGNEYPRNVKYMASRSLYQYLRNLTLSRFGEAIKARFGVDAARALKLGGPEAPLNPVTRPYMRVEFDGHRIDVAFTMLIPNPFGGFIEVAVTRMWLLTIRDTFSRAVLGYHLCYGREYNRFDVMECIKKSLMPWKRRELSIPGLKYSGGFPSDIFPELQWAIFQEFLYDNAKANLSDDVTRLLVDITGCNVNAGPVAFPERRGIVERFFGLFEEHVHRLPSTLGSGPKDPRRQNPEEQALKFKIKAEHIEDLVEVLIALHNDRPTDSLGNRSPLEQLDFFLKSNPIIPTLDEVKKRRLSMFNVRYFRTVRGNMEEGRRPYIEFENVRYTNDILSSSPELIGKQLTIYVDPKDARTCEVFNSDGSELGVLIGKGFWGITQHTLEMRKEINRARVKRLIHYTENDDPIHVYMDYLTQEAMKNKNAKNKLAKIKKSLEDTVLTKPADLEKTEAYEEDPSESTEIDISVFNRKAILV